jgi:diguanylate cyclase (GGDEF)-like protein
LHQLHHLDEGVAALQEARDIFSQAESLSELSATYNALAAVNAELGNWRAAYEARSQAEEISNKVLRNQLDQRFAALKVEFDSTARDKENALLTRENRANEAALAQGERARKLQVAVIGLSVMLAILLGIMAWYQRRGKHSMQLLAMTDELTNVPNRRAVLLALGTILQQRDAATCAMLIVDIDHFKTINDQFGHPVGDETLKLVAQQLRDVTTQPAFVGRMGGEEFVLVLPNSSHDVAMAAAEKLRAAVAELDLSRWLANRMVTVSIGVTLSLPGSDTTSSMLRRADAALYAAKHGGRNCVKYQPPPASHDSGTAMVSDATLLIAERQVG